MAFKIEDMPKNEAGRLVLAERIRPAEAIECCERIEKMLRMAREMREIETSVVRPLVLSSLNEMIWLYNRVARATGTQIEALPERNHVELSAWTAPFHSEALSHIAFVKGAFSDPYLYANDTYDVFQQAAVVNMHKCQHILLSLIEQLLP